MAENLEPVIRLVVEGKGWDGNEWNATTGTPGEATIFPESSEGQRAIVEAIRAHAVERLDYFLAMVRVVRESLDFDLPNQPLRDQVESVHDNLERAREFARILVELAPWLYEDDEGDEDEPEPVPDPEGSARA